MGEIYQLVVESDRHTPMELRGLLQWELGPELRSVPGVIEVNGMGGAAKEYQVVLDPARLAAHGITLGQVVDALGRNNANVGGGWIERDGEQLVIRGEGQLRALSDINDVVVTVDRDGTPIQIRRLGSARIGAALPQGVVTRDGRGEAVTGTFMTLVGQNQARGHDHGARAVRLPRLARRGVLESCAALSRGPIAAVTFTIEEVVGDLDQTVLSGVVVAAALAAAVEHSVLGDRSRGS